MWLSPWLGKDDELHFTVNCPHDLSNKLRRSIPKTSVESRACSELSIKWSSDVNAAFDAVTSTRSPDNISSDYSTSPPRIALSLVLSSGMCIPATIAA